MFEAVIRLSYLLSARACERQPSYSCGCRLLRSGRRGRCVFFDAVFKFRRGTSQLALITCWSRVYKASVITTWCFIAAHIIVVCGPGLPRSCSSTSLAAAVYDCIVLLSSYDCGLRRLCYKSSLQSSAHLISIFEDQNSLPRLASGPLQSTTVSRWIYFLNGVCNCSQIALNGVYSILTLFSLQLWPITFFFSISSWCHSRHRRQTFRFKVERR